MPLLDFTGKVALVTGAASGIGAAVAGLLASQGARVWFADRNGETALKQCESMDGAGWLELDVTKEGDWASSMRHIKDQAGKLDILINAAGISRSGRDEYVGSVSLEDWRLIFSVNVEGTLLGCQHAMRTMTTPGSAIVNVSSTTALAPTATLAAYGASKAAVHQLTKSVAAACSLANLPIRCNAVLPGMADTGMTDAMTPSYRQIWEAQIPAGRFASAGEIANVIAFLASDAASYVNGTGLLVDGGLTNRPVVR